MLIIYALIFFILGTVIGSFANVLVERTIHQRPLLGRSHCDHCQKQLKSFDLIPILSYLFLRGKCRHCHQEISIQHFVFEVTYGVIFATTYLLIQNNIFLSNSYLHNALSLPYLSNIFILIFYLFTLSGLMALFVSDLKYYLLLDRIVFPLIVVTIAYKAGSLLYLGADTYSKLQQSNFGQNLIEAGWLSFRLQSLAYPLLYSFGGALTIALFFLTLIVVTKGKGMGAGDVKLGFLIGLITGWPHMILAIMLGFLTGSATSLILMLVRRKNMKSRIPFGPFLILGAILVLFFGDYLFNSYLKLLGLENAF
ncbi:MAG: type 4 prepilin-like proteins leader peptide-processing enzyme [Patescibacteria group bacterium]|nr:MAG: type 4 prepilin-like proteins leader peptide-processing enzyme [Patescibacteria group bacterium]